MNHASVERSGIGPQHFANDLTCQLFGPKTQSRKETKIKFGRTAINLLAKKSYKAGGIEMAENLLERVIDYMIDSQSSWTHDQMDSAGELLGEVQIVLQASMEDFKKSSKPGTYNPQSFDRLVEKCNTTIERFKKIVKGEPTQVNGIKAGDTIKIDKTESSTVDSLEWNTSDAVPGKVYPGL